MPPYRSGKGSQQALTGFSVTQLSTAGLEATRIRVLQRIIETVGIPIVILGVVWCLGYRIRTQHSPQARAIDPPVHVDHPNVVQVFMARIAPLLARGDGASLPGARHAPLAPGVVTQALQYRAGAAGDRRDAAQVIPVEVFLRDHRTDVFPHQDGATMGLDHMAGDRLAAARAVFEAATDIVRGFAIALLGVALTIGGIGKGVLNTTLTEVSRLIVTGPQDAGLISPKCKVAVGIVSKGSRASPQGDR